MEEHIGLDVSLKESMISVRQNGKRIWRGQCPSDPKVLAEVIRKRAPNAKRIVFETGPLSVWFYHALTAEGLPAICIDARHANAALNMAPKKTDADGLAHLAEVGFYQEVRVNTPRFGRCNPANRGVKCTETASQNRRRDLLKSFGEVPPCQLPCADSAKSPNPGTRSPRPRLGKVNRRLNRHDPRRHPKKRSSPTFKTDSNSEPGIFS